MSEQATSPPAPAPAPRSPAPPRRLGRVLEWFTRAQALSEVRGYRRTLPPREQQALPRALRAQELADRAYDPVDPLRAGPSTALAVSLYREALYWALLREHSAATSLSEAVDAWPRGELEELAGGPEALSMAVRALVDRSFIETAALPPEVLAEEARHAKAFVNAVLTRRLAPERVTGRLLLQRAVRSLALLGVLVAVVLGALTSWKNARRGPDLAEGKPWRASSSSATCRPADRRCAGVTTGIFFHTHEETNPWVELDLGQAKPFNRVEVTNRDDCCPDRAVPMIIEVGTDGEKWKEVARRTDSFAFWQAELPAQNARYVRLRVPRRTVLHLNKVSVRYAQ